MHEIVYVGGVTLRGALVAVWAQVAEEAHVLSVARLLAVLPLEADRFRVAADFVCGFVECVFDVSCCVGDRATQRGPKKRDLFFGSRMLMLGRFNFFVFLKIVGHLEVQPNNRNNREPFFFLLLKNEENTT